MNTIPRKKGSEESPVPVSVVYHSFLELDEEKLKLLFRHDHRGRSLSVAATERR